ncbi:hypothetical protein [Psychrobacillus sp. OK032]|uniref:hypothetical protein n=1 Tax=Psychrobacillus sp. OK032 TaxID=1884358 RepID=UPI0008C4CDC5|nr:hypothetical protein [Psychrobacillus sp. OK032]SER97489.1 hypothetical protein SAMN05518872_1035 [Psychrobacillus sp. OK032]
MKKYEKMLIAFNDEEFNCFALKGSWLYIANKKDTKKGLFRLRNDLYYFVSIDNQRLPSEFGVVKKLDVPISAMELAELDYVSRKKDTSLLTADVVKEYEWFLDKVNSQPENTPMAVTWLERVFPKKEKVLRVHKIFFSELTKEEKQELFES